MDIKETVRECHQIAIDHGWWETARPIPEILCLIHSEVSEALEAYRNDDAGGFAEELADIIIRTFDFTAAAGIDIEYAIRAKMNKNILRPYRHGNKRC